MTQTSDPQKDAPESLTPSAIMARRIRELRERHGWTAAQLASRCAEAGMPSLTRSVIANAESGRRRGGFTLEETFVLAYVLDVAPVYLFLPVEVALVRFTPKWDTSVGYVREWVRGNYPLPEQDAGRYWSQRPEVEWDAEKDAARRLPTASGQEIKRWLEGPPTEGSE
jgi:transcriptional regulator with XRE-family HTH domain